MKDFFVEILDTICKVLLSIIKDMSDNFFI